MPRHLAALNKNCQPHFLDESDKLINNGLRKQLIEIEKKKTNTATKDDTKQRTRKQKAALAFIFYFPTVSTNVNEKDRIFVFSSPMFEKKSIATIRESGVPYTAYDLEKEE
jgi:hypothetical protein